MGLFNDFNKFGGFMSDGPNGWGGSGILYSGESEKKRQTQEYISEAKQYVREGKEIYDNAFDSVSSYASETEKKLRQHNEYKRQLIKKLGDTESILNDFSRFNIDSKYKNVPRVNAGVSVGNINMIGTAISSCIPQREKTSMFGELLSEYDYHKAKKQRDEAEEYKAKMKKESEKLYQYKENMSEIQAFISSEREQLDSLMKKVNKMTFELSSAMKKDKFTANEADYLKGIHKITEQIVQMLSTQFLTDSFSITSKYGELYDNVKKINQSLPDVPSVKDHATLEALRIILESVPVVY